MNKKIYIFLFFIFSLLITNITFANKVELQSFDKIDKEYINTAYSMIEEYTSDEDVMQSGLVEMAPIPPENMPKTIVTSPINGIQTLLYIYTPQKQINTKLPVLYYCHGGGFLFRNALGNYKRYQKLSDDLNLSVVVPKYRLSSEAPFPAALDDAYNGLKYIYNHSEELNLDNSKIILIGDSAGGGLAASLALYNRDHDNLPLLSQILIYPMLDNRTGSNASLYHSKYTGEICWTPKSNQFAWKKLQGNKEISSDMLAYFSPSQAKNFTNLPPTLIYVGDLDLFANEDIAYANNLVEAGIPTELYLRQGLYHAFEAAQTAKKTQEFWQTIYDYINTLLNK